MASFADLPEEVVVEIMSWLPPESLLRFICVSKSWYVLINSLVKNTKFVAKHLYNSSNKSSSLVLMCLKNKYSKTQHHEILTIYNDEDNTEQLSYAAKDFEPHKLPGTKFFSAQSHCNGIICLISNHNILLCNPATRGKKFLPNPCFHRDLFMTIRVGFGYDSIHNVYKVVRVFGFFGDLRAEVHTLGSDTCWREIKMEIENKDDYYYPTSQQVYCKGVYYWLVSTKYEEHNSNQIVQSFDIHDEEFHSIPLPAHFPSVYNTVLTQWNESSLALFYYPKAVFAKVPIEMWGMNVSISSKVCNNWTKHLSIAPLEGIYMIPMAFLGSDHEELILRDGSLRLFAYNLLTKKVRSLHRRGAIAWLHGFGYVKSLVQLT
ncbi:F-box domain containing protein [Trema orientale]|uniref:F-box domain containing protein n=1 Tax=Trema orientale TaxID=63057 RepID=A0A2P5FVK9_TREOI|nr:F-box domain containing protein [Trema orientale]